MMNKVDIITYLESLRSIPIDRGTRILKGRMEYAVEDSWEKSTELLGDPMDGVEMHDFSILADSIISYLVDKER